MDIPIKFKRNSSKQPGLCRFGVDKVPSSIPIVPTAIAEDTRKKRKFSAQAPEWARWV